MKETSKNSRLFGLRRIAIVSASVCVVGGMTFAALANPASAKGVRASTTNLVHLSSIAGPKGATITTGSQWTLQYYYLFGGYQTGECEVLTFVSTKAWTSDKGDTGSLKLKGSKATLNDTNGDFFPIGTFSLKLGSSTSPPAFLGSEAVTSAGNTDTYGPMVLVQGVDPYGIGGC
jgi:hypothetical protein